MARRLVMVSESPLNTALTLIDMVGLDTLALPSGAGLATGSNQRSASSTASGPCWSTLGGAGWPWSRHALAVDAARFLEQHNLGDLFALCVTQETTQRLKPHPQPVTYAARALGVAPSGV